MLFNADEQRNERLFRASVRWFSNVQRQCSAIALAEITSANAIVGSVGIAHRFKSCRPDIDFYAARRIILRRAVSRLATRGCSRFSRLMTRFKAPADVDDYAGRIVPNRCRARICQVQIQLPLSRTTETIARPHLIEQNDTSVCRTEGRAPNRLREVGPKVNASSEVVEP